LDIWPRKQDKQQVNVMQRRCE